MQYSIVGSGNLAHSLAKALNSSGYTPKFIHSRNEKNGRTFAKRFGFTFENDLKNFDHKGFIFLAVNDDQIKAVAGKLPKSEAMICHSSGSVSISAISVKHKRRAVLYPLQSFKTKKTISLRKVPICVEGSDGNTTAEINQLANKLSDSVYQFNSKIRKQIHLSAVIANNFSNHLLKLSFDHLEKFDVDPDILYPLIRSTYRNALKHDPAVLQTGPAKRKDQQVIDEHLRMLKKNRSLQKVYEVLSKSISNSK
ncbi:MAG: DUF2520 domain-containing protein [Bacteroidia bacterium]|nr:DUF2520 domain-containing protein [Bacteroidia bacterium]